MKAVALTSYTPFNEPAAFKDIELPLPEPGEHDLRIRVEAVGVNHGKLHSVTRQVFEQPRILGYDAAGVVDTVGSNVNGFSPGDPVYYAGDAFRAGSNAHYQLIDARMVATRPDTLDATSAASLPLCALTAWELMFQRMPFDSECGGQGKSLLVIGGAGGVGSIAIQLGRRAGFTVIATASRPESTRWCSAMGAHHVINYRQPLPPQLATLGFTQVDVALNLFDTVRYWEVLGQLLAPLGHLGIIVAPTEPLPLGDPYKAKCISIHWEWMFARARFHTRDMAEQGRILSRVAALIDAGELKPIVWRTLSPINAANLREAHRQIDSNTTMGKLVLTDWS